MSYEEDSMYRSIFHEVAAGLKFSEPQRMVVVDREGMRRRKGVKKREETLQDEGTAEEKGQLLFLSYGNGNEVGHGARDNRGPQAG